MVWRVIRKLLGITFFAAIVVITNIALLTFDAVYDLAKRGLWNMASIVADVGEPRTHASAQDRNLRLSDRNADLMTDNARLQTRVSELQTRDPRPPLRRPGTDPVPSKSDNFINEARTINERLARRTSRSISTNVSSMALEAVPYLGATVIVGVTFMEVRDACLTLADTRALSALLEGSPIDDVPFCGYSAAELMNMVHFGADKNVCDDLNESLPEELLLDCLAMEPPDATLEEEVSAPEPMKRPGEQATE